MPELVTKMPLQEKIAELERRIVELERQRPLAMQTSVRNEDNFWNTIGKAFERLLGRASR